MRLVNLNAGRLELVWTWLPYWMVTSAVLSDVERLLFDVVRLNAATTSEEDLDALHCWVTRHLESRFKIVGLGAYCDALRYVQISPPPAPAPDVA